MEQVRISTPEDIPAQRELWALAFGDSGEYVDNFYRRYYRPERVLVLEEEGVVRAMTAWFDTTFVVPGQGEYRTAYLYAVATHPDCRGRGLAGRLLAGADKYFRTLGIPAVSTVPAEPSLHRFFGKNGFRECFELTERSLPLEPLTGEIASERSATGGAEVRRVDAEEYGRLREMLLESTAHIRYPVDALAYQAGCCELSGGGLYAAQTPAGVAVLCAEGAGNGLMIGKEMLGSATAKRLFMNNLPSDNRVERWLIREPLCEMTNVQSGWPFAMLKWLDEDLQKHWNWMQKAYLGLAFD